MEKATCPSTPLTLSEELRKAFSERNVLTTRSKTKVLSALNEFTKASQIQKRKELREKAISEIFTSEISYLKQLELIMKVRISFFMEPLRNKSWLPQTTFQALFGNIEIIYNVNGELLRELKKQNGNVGAAFSQLAPYLKLYSVYAYDYKQALQILQAMQKNNKELNEFVIKTEKRPEVATSLQSLLIVPIQRIPRYKLLLQEVLNYSPLDDTESVIIKDALKKIEEVALHINDLVNLYENTESMLEIARRLSSSPVDIIQPGRKILKQGVLMKVSKSGGTSNPRFVVLFNDSLMYCKGADEGPLKFSGLFPIRNCQLETVLSTSVFKITCQDEMLLLYTSNSVEGREWVSAIQAAIKEHHECRRTLRKESSRRKPVHRRGVLSQRNIPTTPKLTKSKHVGCFGRFRLLR